MIKKTSKTFLLVTGTAVIASSTLAIVQSQTNIQTQTLNNSLMKSTGWSTLNTLDPKYGQWILPIGYSLENDKESNSTPLTIDLKGKINFNNTWADTVPFIVEDLTQELKKTFKADENILQNLFEEMTWHVPAGNKSIDTKLKDDGVTSSDDHKWFYFKIGEFTSKEYKINFKNIETSTYTKEIEDINRILDREIAIDLNYGVSLDQTWEDTVFYIKKHVDDLFRYDRSSGFLDKVTWHVPAGNKSIDTKLKDDGVTSSDDHKWFYFKIGGYTSKAYKIIFENIEIAKNSREIKDVTNILSNWVKVDVNYEININNTWKDTILYIKKHLNQTINNDNLASFLDKVTWHVPAGNKSIDTKLKDDGVTSSDDYKGFYFKIGEYKSKEYKIGFKNIDALTHTKEFKDITNILKNEITVDVNYEININNTWKDTILYIKKHLNQTINNDNLASFLDKVTWHVPAENRPIDTKLKDDGVKSSVDYKQFYFKIDGYTSPLYKINFRNIETLFLPFDKKLIEATQEILKNQTIDIYAYKGMIWNYTIPKIEEHLRKKLYEKFGVRRNGFFNDVLQEKHIYSFFLRLKLGISKNSRPINTKAKNDFVVAGISSRMFYLQLDHYTSAEFKISLNAMFYTG